MKKTLLLFGLLFISHYHLIAQATFPKNDVSDKKIAQYLFTNATIHVDAETVLEKSSIYIKNGIIEAVGKNLTAPAGTITQDLNGKHIYPSFIDLYSSYGMPDVPKSLGRGYGSVIQFESNKQGAFNWNQAIKPEVEAASEFKVNQAQADEMRKNGFGAALTHIPDGIVRGTGALVSFSDEKENLNLIRAKASAHYSLNKGSSTQSYPVSVMGSVALLRQTYYDADWYKKGGFQSERNLSLEAFQNNQSIPQIYEANDKFGLLRGDKIAKEFGFKYILMGNGDEYQLIDEIKAMQSPLIIPMNFPAAYDVEDPVDAQMVTLSELKHWEMAPANAGILAKEGVNFAISSHGIKNKADFWTNLRKAIQYGLSEKKALEALTTIPAQLLKIDDKLGSLKSGMIANFIISSSSIFDKDNTIHENWIQGKKFVINDMNTKDVRGKYDVKIGDVANIQLIVNGKIDKPEFTFAQDSIKTKAKATRMSDLFTFSLKLNKKDENEARLTAYLQNNDLLGEAVLSNGSIVKWQAIFKENLQEIAKKDSATSLMPKIGKMIFPFTAYGNFEKPKQETMLIKNATVWTNEKEGVVANTDVLVQNGKIAKIGQKLTAPQDAKILDGTGKHLTNGIFDEHSHIALFSINENQSVSSEVRQEDALNSDDINIYRQLAGGVTSSQLLHGSADCIGGQSALIKLKWGETPNNLLIKGADGFIKFALGENVKNGNYPTSSGRFPQTRMGVEQVFVDAFQRAVEYEKQWNEYLKSPNKSQLNAPKRDLELDALVEILNKKRFITCHSYVQSEINMLMKVADSFNFKVNTFTHILEGYKVADKMKQHGVNASSFSDWWAYKMEVKDAIPYNAAILTKVGVTTAINSDDAEMARRLNQEAAKTVLYGGMSEEEAWKMVTLNPAKMLHLDNRLGSIKTGKDADLVLWNNHPLSIYARPEQTIIDGTVYFDSQKDEEMQKFVVQEKNRIISSMLKEKSSGATLQKVTPKRNQHIHCDTILEEGVTEECNRCASGGRMFGANLFGSED